MEIRQETALPVKAKVKLTLCTDDRFFGPGVCELLERIREKGILIVPVLLHVGLGTFRPVKVEDVETHVMHSEFCQVTPEAAEKLNAVRKNGGRIVCV